VSLDRRLGELEKSTGTAADAPLFSGYHDDPVGFAVDVLGITPWGKQAEFLRAVAANDRVAVKAGHKVSKSNSLAILSLWFVSTRSGGRVIFTNSSARQVRTVNWYEFKKLYRKAKQPIGGELFDVPDRGLEFADGRQVIGFSTDEPDRWGGISGENLLFIVDEASGVPEIIFDAINGNCAGDNAKVVLTGNPLRPVGRFYEVFSSLLGWVRITISSLDTPNYIEGREVIRGLASRKWRQQMEDDYGLESPLYQTRVLGEFAQQSEYAVVGLGDVLAATARHELAVGSFALAGPLVLGVDAARFGDDESVIIVRRGLVALTPIAIRGADGPTLAARVAGIAEQHRTVGERPIVNIDVIGIGASPYDALKAYGWIDARAINVAESPTTNNHYSRLRDQLWFELAAWLKAGGCIPNDRKLHGELCAPTYAFDISGNRKVEGKADIKKKIKRSPDRADALALAVYDPAHDDCPQYDDYEPSGFRRRM
jgi:phage terminase large subunit